MKARRKIGRARRKYMHGGTVYLNNHHEHDHRGMKLYNPETGATIWVKRDFIYRVG